MATARGGSAAPRLCGEGTGFKVAERPGSPWLSAPGEVEHQPENDDGNHCQHYVKEQLTDPRCAPRFPVAQLGALGDPHFFGMLKIQGHFVGAGVTVLGVALERTIDDLLKFWRDG